MKHANLSQEVLRYIEKQGSPLICTTFFSMEKVQKTQNGENSSLARDSELSGR